MTAAKLESKYMRSEDLHATGNTRRVAVINKVSGDRLGVIAWYGPWRQYVLHPAAGAVFNGDCLLDIQHFLAVLMEEWRTER